MSYRNNVTVPQKSPVHVLPGDALALGELRLTFQRTLRIPDDGRHYPLPPGLGHFPIRKVDDYLDRVPEAWREQGGVMIPMYQREAMWLSFGSAVHALKIGVGKVCAVTGERWQSGLEGRPQRYVVTGTQPWLDGIATSKGTIRQFVAMPLGMGYTVEGQITGEERFGGIQLEAFAPKPGRLRRSEAERDAHCMPVPCCAPMGGAMPGAPRAFGGSEGMRPRKSAGMGLAAGGRMNQKIYADPHGIDTWEQEARARVFVHIVSSDQWREITGEEAPPSPVTAKTYQQHGYPWFNLYDEHVPALNGSDKLADVKSIAEKDLATFGNTLSDESPVSAWPVRMLKKLGLVRDGEW